MNTAKLAPRRRLLALGTASALAIAAASPALAQDAAATEEDPAATPAAEPEAEIIVTGFRASLKGAQDIKRNADTFVDAITAEDIGALPDRSVAEALQRVPGVNIGRFEKPSDPDRFSVEGTGVIIRGLGFVRSELNGRDIFSANGGTVLSFNEVSPELLGSVLVFKNLTADMVEGGIAGTVNLRTRKPLDRRGFHISGTLETNVGDLAEEWSPGGSVLLSNTWETDAGTLGFQFGYARSELVSRTDASQVADPCYRPANLTGSCFRVRPVGSGGINNGVNPNFTPDNFPPPGALVVPKGAGVRTTDLERDREAFSSVIQYESPDRSFLMTFEWLRADTTFFTKENAAIALVNDDALFPVPAAGSTWEFNDQGQFVRGVLSQRIGDAYANPFGRGGIPLELLRFERETRSSTEDFSFDVDWNITDRLRVNFEAQHIQSELGQDSIIANMATWANIDLDLSGKVPQVQFLAPPGAPADYFTSGRNTYYWFLLDSIARNEGELDTLRADLEYDISEDGFFKQVKFGARWSDRGQTTRDTNFSTWGNLSAPWAGRAGCAPWGQGNGCSATAPGVLVYPDFDPGRRFPDQRTNGFVPGRFFTGLPGQEFAIAGGAFVDDFPNYANLRSPFDNGFQRGNGPSPLPGGAFFFGGDNFLQEYLSGASAEQAREINTFSQTPNPFFGVRNRSFFNSVTRQTSACDPFCQNEISEVSETTKAAYARVDYGTDFDNGWKLTGNFGLRYIETEVLAVGEVGFPNPFFFDTGPGGNRDGVVQISEVNAACAQSAQQPPELQPAYCRLSPQRLAQFAAAHTGEVLIDDRSVTFDNWLPSFNALLDTGNGLLFRAAVSKGISRPDLAAFRSGGGMGDNTGDLRSEGTLETGPLFQLFTGNRNLRPIESWNYDLSVEWYFDRVGSVTLNAFAKDIKGIVNNGADIVDFTSPSGVTLDVEVNGPDNRQDGLLKGVELSYQQTYDFLPGLLSGLGSQLTYTYVDGSDFQNTNLANNQSDFAAFQPLAGISKHTVNAVLFYEKDWLSARAAYNWRSAFLITPRDDIFPFSPIWGEETGQLDASIFVTVRDGLKLGVQGVNLLDEVFRTSQVIDFDGTRVQRSAFRNDRRFTFLARFDF
ncbi:TonB-dependent receptor domain-containing protein [Erythrobacter oryzae]|uniref:TonB-dependent receptor domain-containing protein n=1 Tax=Erythrobacter oryzae TaxID=3019556 RepID=UPI0025527F13|nr:TonB-dependent receptor [Erythrobacter sp. COR-2]